MAYAYFHSKRHTTNAVFDLFFRKNPFDGEYTIFAGLTEVMAFLNTYKFTGSFGVYGLGFRVWGLVYLPGCVRSWPF